MDRISTGISGLDEMLGGGLIPGRTYMVKGGPGAGKTTLCMHFLVAGASAGEKTMYISLDEPVDEVREEMSIFGFDMENVEFVDASPTGKDALFKEAFYTDLIPGVEGFRTVLSIKMQEIKPSRVVIDPITMLELAYDSEIEYRRDLLSLLKILRSSKSTTILTAELNDRVVEDYLVSGVIELRRYEISGQTKRGVKIIKMRCTAFDESIRPYQITSRGMEVYASSSLAST